MADIYIVLIVSLISWAGIFFYLIRLDLCLKKMEKRYEE